MRHTDDYIDVVRGPLQWRYMVEGTTTVIWARRPLQGLIEIDVRAQLRQVYDQTTLAPDDVVSIIDGQI